MFENQGADFTGGEAWFTLLSYIICSPTGSLKSNTPMTLLKRLCANSRKIMNKLFIKHLKKFIRKLSKIRLTSALLGAQVDILMSILN